jgi:hypothetical protein
VELTVYEKWPRSVAGALRLWLLHLPHLPDIMTQ